MRKTENSQDQWSTLLDSLVDDILEMSDEEVLRTFPEDAQVVNGTRAMIQGLVGSPKMSPIQAVQRALATKPEATIAIPSTPMERRSLFDLILRGSHEWSGEATLAFRELMNIKEVSDSEIQGFLEDLAELHDEEP